MDNQQENNTTKVKKRFYKQWWFWLIIGVVVLSITLVATGVLKVRIKDPDPQPSNPTPTTEYFIGDKVVVGDLEYTVKQVVDSQIFMIGDEIIKTENNFIKIVFTVKNISNSSTYLWASNMNLYKGQAKYEVKYGSVDLSGYNLAPELVKEFTIIFEVPNKTDESTYKLEVKNSLKTQSIILKNRQAG